MGKESCWFVYFVRCKDNSLYTGITVDLSRRLHEHNHSDKGAKYTRCRRPVSLVYYQQCTSRSDASQKEYAFKKITKLQKEKLIEQFTKNSDA